MFGFGKRQAPVVDANAVAHLTERVGQLETLTRRLEDELTEMHARWVKQRRALAAERTNQEREDTGAVPVESVPPSAPQWGARSRWGGNGVHP